ncbi:Cationic amino acid transporter 1 [Platanthera guangdongensis]|uniref:Cationic amino acid transporter 1 n=1 Tax=Platanthera guangdongensis TaxID=2320717 RepID=A0ABR2MP29_9ASPA
MSPSSPPFLSRTPPASTTLHASIVHMVVILFIVIVGLTKAYTYNLAPLTSLGMRRIFSSSAILFFAYIGFNVISSMKKQSRKLTKTSPSSSSACQSRSSVTAFSP